MKGICVRGSGTAGFCALLLWSPLAAQAVPDSLVGSRVRVELTEQPDGSGRFEQQTLHGTLAAITGDTLRIAIHPDARTVAIALPGIERLDRSLGIDRVREALRNSLGGAAIYGALGYVMPPFGAETSADGALIGAGIGLLAGMVSGVLLPDEKWTSIFER